MKLRIRTDLTGLPIGFRGATVEFVRFDDSGSFSKTAAVVSLEAPRSSHGIYFVVFEHEIAEMPQELADEFKLRRMM